MCMHCEMYGQAKKKRRYIMYMAYHSNTIGHRQCNGIHTETQVKTYLVLMAVAILLVLLAAQTIMERIERRGAPAARGAVTVVVHTRRGW